MVETGLPPNISQVLGAIMQIAFVPHDFEAALDFWTKTMGVGPFYMLDHIPLVGVRYRGVPTDIDQSVALGYWGDMQIELIVQHNDAPSTYSEWLLAGREGVHHVGVAVPDMASAQALLESNGGTVVHEAELPGGAQASYIEMPGPAPIVELIHLDPKFDKLFDFIKSAAIGWDGKDPVRAIPAESEWGTIQVL